MTNNKGYLRLYKTALITGASKGIGYELALQLAALGKELILVARDKEKLSGVKEGIEKQFGGKVHVYACDLSSEAELSALMQAIGKSLPFPDLLINNAGAGCYAEFHQLSLPAQIQIIRLNTEAAVALSHKLLQRMVRENKGAILNVASTGGFMPIPLNAVYSASKAFIINFSLSVGKEVKRYGVNVSCLCPGPVNTGFWQSAGMGELIKRHKGLPAPRYIAEYAIKLIQSGRPLGIPGMFVKFKHIVRFFLPRPLLSAYLYRHMKAGKL